MHLYTIIQLEITIGMTYYKSQQTTIHGDLWLDNTIKLFYNVNI